MNVGLSYDLKDTGPALHDSDDAQEEYDCAETINIVKSSLEDEGHKVVLLGGGREFIDNIMTSSVDYVFNIAEGRGVYRSREAQVPAILEMLDIPYSGSDPQCLAICLDKPLTKKLVQLAGVLTPRWQLIKNLDEIDTLSHSEIDFPVIVKPAYEGSSKGVRSTSLVENYQEAEAGIIRMLDCYRQPVMIEQFINGDEVTVGIIGNGSPEVLGIMRIMPRERTEHFVYSLEVKRDWQRLVGYECPAALPEKLSSRIKADSLAVFNTLGCRDFARIDFRIDNSGIPYFIEVNPLPGLGTYSDLVIMAQKMGHSHQKLISDVFKAAVKERPPLKCTSR